MINLAENAKIRTENVRRMAANRVQELTHTAQDKATELGTQAREKIGGIRPAGKDELLSAPA